VQDFAPVGLVLESPLVIAVRPDFPAKTTQELIEQAKASPGKIKFTSPGFGSLPHLAGELLKQSAGVDLRHVRYANAQAAIAAVRNGEADVLIEFLGTASRLLRSGELRGLAITSDRRHPAAPDLPTVAEAGFPNYDVNHWFGLAFPAGTPGPIVDKTNTALGTVLGREAVRKRSEFGFLQARSPEEYGQHVAREIRKWQALFRTASTPSGPAPIPPAPSASDAPPPSASAPAPAGPASATPGAAQRWPERPIALVVGFAARDGLDVVARAVAPALAELLGQPINVENKPGSAGLLAADSIITAPKDGYTVLFDNYLRVVHGTMSPDPYKRPQLAAGKPLQPVGLAAAMPLLIAARPDLGVTSLQELVATARASPGKIRVAAGSSGSMRYIGAAQFQQAAGVQFKFIEYADIRAAVGAVQNNEADVILDGLAPLLRPVRSGELRALALTSAQRHPGLADVPTAAEAGVANFVLTVWTGLALPAGTPGDVVETVNKSLKEALAREPVRKRIQEAGFLVQASSPDDHVRQNESDLKTLQALLQRPVPMSLPTPPSLPDKPKSVVLSSDGRGHFQLEAEVDGHPIRFMVDTGATAVSLTAKDAAKLGIRPQSSDYTVRVRTASGTKMAAPAKLNSVKVGNIVVRDVRALVSDKTPINLLGMSFLSRIKFSHERGKLVLEQ
jgi:clan AA aspartic protease (TIGR02281 family)